MAEENGDKPQQPQPDAVVVIAYFKDSGMCQQQRQGEFPMPLLVNMLEVIKAELIERQRAMAAQAQAAAQSRRIQLPGQAMPPSF